MRSARPLRMRSTPSTIASVPVLHALELVVTWLPSASRPETRAETPLAITCSTDGAAEAAHLAGVGERHDLRGDRVHAADAGAEDRAGVPVHALVVARRAARGRRRARPRSRRGSA